MAKHPWRFQCDVGYGEDDPIVTVFVGEVFERGDGSKFVEQSTNDAVTMKLSEVGSALSLADAATMTKKHEAVVAARVKAAEEPPKEKPKAKAKRKRK